MFTKFSSFQSCQELEIISSLDDYVINIGGPCKSRIFGGRGYLRVGNPRVTSNVLVLKPQKGGNFFLKSIFGHIFLSKDCWSLDRQQDPKI